MRELSAGFFVSRAYVVVMPSRAALLVLAALVLLAGCGGGPAEPTTESSTATTTEPTTTTTTATATTTAPETTLGEAEVDAAAATADVLAAIDAVETYRVEAEIRRTRTANAVTREATVESSGVFDRTNQALRVEQTTARGGQSVTVTTYLLDGTLYQQSPAFVPRFSAEWVFLELEHPERRWRALDTLTRQRATVENGSVSVLGARTFNGTEAYVLAVDADEDSYNEFVERRLGDAATNVSVEVTDATFRYVVAGDSGRPLRARGTVNSTVSTGGQTVSLTEQITLRFRDYGTTADIELPAAADTAVDLANRTATR